MADREQEQVFCTKLVETVERYPCLYNYSLPEYTNKLVVESTWEAVGKELDASADCCKRKWRNIRTVFSRNLRFSLSGCKRKKPYYLNDVLHFLVDFMRPSLSDVTGTLPPVPQQNKEAITIVYDYDEDEEVDMSTTTNSPTPLQPISKSPPQSSSHMIQSQPTSILSELENKNANKRVKGQPKLSTADISFIDYSQQSTVPETSSRKQFLLSLLSDVERMTDQQYRSFRMKMLYLIDGIIDSSTTTFECSTPSESSSPLPQMTSQNYQHSSSWLEYDAASPND